MKKIGCATAGWIVGLGLLNSAIARSDWARGAIAVREPSIPTDPLPEPSVDSLEQLPCRRTNQSIGVYIEPNTTSQPIAILPVDQTVRLQAIGDAVTVGGWARITEPVIGWVTADALTPPRPCVGLTLAAPSAPTPSPSLPLPVLPPNPSTPSSPSSPDPNPTLQTPEAGQRPEEPIPEEPIPEEPILEEPIAEEPIAEEPVLEESLPESSSASVPPIDRPPTTVVLTCRVSDAGVPVFSQPIVAQSTYIGTLPEGTYQFQFTENRQTLTADGTGVQQWIYTLTPVAGWVMIGTIDDMDGDGVISNEANDFGIGGSGCG